MDKKVLPNAQRLVIAADTSEYRPAKDDRAASAGDARVKTLAQRMSGQTLRSRVAHHPTIAVDVANEGVNEGDCRVGGKQVDLLFELRRVPQASPTSCATKSPRTSPRPWFSVAETPRCGCRKASGPRRSLRANSRAIASVPSVDPSSTTITSRFE